ncbi:MAG: filamentous hemagglutinin N-terminal domain-containing protein [Marinobacter sp.]|nr:filamentous hemagglutinin N-terminal domain-containing protein [Marinobacter sp.]
MNRVYQVIWNRSKGVWQAASELSHSSRGSSSGAGSVAGSLKTISAGAILLIAIPLHASDLPSDGTVVGGQGSINSSGKTLTVNQSSQNMAINWQDFSIAEGHTVNFHQPNAQAAALNRVTGNNVSDIRGALNANGRVFLVNPNGVMFSSTARVDVGSLVTSTLDISTDDFMAGNYRFEGASANAIINQGNITTAEGGVVAMIAAEIINTGSITTPQGSTLMGAGSKVTLDLGGPLKIEVEEALLDTYIEQGGAIRADGGLVYLTAKAAGELASSVINHTGVTEARTLATGENGQIMLMGDMGSGRVEVAGTLDASAPDGGDGGFIETSAASVKINDNLVVTTKAESGQTGEWLIDPVDITIAASGGNVTGDTIATALQTTDVTLDTSGSGSCTSNSCSSLSSGNGDISVNDNIQVTTGTTDTTLTLKANRDIIVDENVSISSTSGKLNTIFWADQDATDGGMIWMKNGSSIDTNGGHLWLGGGSGTSNWNGLSVGDGRATGNSVNSNGIVLIGTNLNTGNGNMAFYGRGRPGTYSSVATSVPGQTSFYNSNGIRLENGNNLNSGSGTIHFDGYTNAVDSGSSANGVEFSAYKTDQITSSSNETVAIQINGRAENNDSSDNSWGVYTWGAQIASTGAGGIQIKGSGAKNAGVAIANGAHVLADSGLITLEGLGSGSGFSDVRIEGAVGQKAGTGITASSSDIDVIADTLNVSGTLASSGTLAIRTRTNDRKINVGGSDATGLELAAGYFSTNFENGFSNIVIGDTNSDTITVGGAVTYQDNLTLKSGTSIVVNNSGSLTGSVGENASLTLWARADGNLTATDGKVGSVWLQENSTVDTNGGDITIGGGTDPLAGYAWGDDRTGGLGENNAIYRGASINGTLDAGGGDISIRGRGKSSIAARGVSIAGDISTAGTGDINIYGYAVGGSDAVAIGDSATAITDNDGHVSADAGTIYIWGQKDAGKSINVNSGSSISSNGAIVLNGRNGEITSGSSDYIQTDQLLILDASQATFNSAQNDINTLAADGIGGGGLSVTDMDDLTIGTISWENKGYQGIQATGNMSLSTLSGNLTVNEDLSTSSTSSNAITLNAGQNESAGTSTGGDIEISGASITTGSGGRALLYTGSIAGSTGLTNLVGSGSGRFRYNSDESSQGYTAALGTSGLHAIYREQPTINVAAQKETISYGDSLPGYTASYSGYTNGDTKAAITGSASWSIPTATTSTSGNLVADSYDVQYSGGLSSTLGYKLADNTGSTGELTVSKRALSLQLSGTSSRVYDGTSDIGFTGYTVNATGGINGDNLMVATGSLTGFVNKNAGENKQVTFTGFGLSGTDASNYELVSGSAKSSASITARPLTVDANNQSKSVGQPDPTLTYNVGCGAFSSPCGLVASDKLSGRLARTGGETVGRYAINLGSLGNPNYAIKFIPGTFEIAINDDPARETSIQAIQQTLPLSLATTSAGMTGPDISTAGQSNGLEVVDVDSSTAQSIVGGGESRTGGPLQLFVVDGGISFGDDS